MSELNFSGSQVELVDGLALRFRSPADVITSLVSLSSSFVSLVLSCQQASRSLQ